MPSNKVGLTTSDNALAPLGGSQIDAAIDAIEPYVVCRFATTGARDTAFPASAGGRPAGTVAFVPSVGYHQTALTVDAAWTRLAEKVTVVPTGAIVGTFDATKPLKLWTFKTIYTTDAAGRAWILAAATIGSGCVLAGYIGGSDGTYNVHGVVSDDGGGNVIATFWNAGTKLVSTSLAVQGFMVGQ